MNAYLKMLRRTFDISAGVMLIYRSNVVFFLMFETFFILAQFLSISVGYDLAGGPVAGWSRQEAYVLTAVNYLSHHVFLCFFINQIFTISSNVWNGQFDYILLKPLHPLASIFFTGQFSVSNIPNMVISLGLVAWLMRTGTHVDATQLLTFVVLFIVGVLVRVALALLCMAPVFFSEKLGDVEDSFWSISGLARYPMSVYPRALAAMLTFVVPIGMVASVPASALFGKLSPEYLVAALAAAVVFVVVATWLFMVSLRSYQSVNSGV